MPLKNVKLGANISIVNESLVNLYDCIIGDNTKIGPFVEIQKNVIVGKNCKISSHTFICEGVEIKDNVFIGHNVTFINDKLPIAVNSDGNLKTDNDWKLEKTILNKGVSIGSGSTILCGIDIGENAMIGAGSVVTNNINAHTTVYGNPAKEKK
jgi:acetyltransferase-like isoleucine patch superfamily enzyme